MDDFGSMAGKPAAAETARDAKKAEQHRKNLEMMKEQFRFGHSKLRKLTLKKIERLEEADQSQYHDMIVEFAREDLDPTVKAACLGTIGRLDLEAGRPVLVEALKEDNEDVRRASVRSISRLEYTPAAPALMELVKEADFKENNTLLISAIQTLGRLKHDDTAFFEGKGEDPETHAEVKQVIALYFGTIESATAKEPLLKWLRDEDEQPLVRAYAANSLGKLKDPAAIEPLKETLEEIRSITNPGLRARLGRLRLNSMMALLRLGERSVEKEVLSMARDDDANVRLNTAKQMGDLQLTEGLPTLKYMADRDPSRSVQLAARKAVKAMEPSWEPKWVHTLRKQSETHRSKKVRREAKRILKKLEAGDIADEEARKKK